MKVKALLLAALAGACASTQTEAPRADQCPAPRLIASPLMVGDGARDRGYPGGVSLADVDSDGDLDLMATEGYYVVLPPGVREYTFRPNTLYLNDGAGRFTHSADPEFSVADNPNSGSTWGDVDGDGDLDAFIGTQHYRPDIFLRNQGGHFVREQLGEATTTRGSNFSASWVDIDGDGDLDLMSGGATLERAQPLLIYRNDAGNFVRVRDIAIENGTSNAGAIIWADFDNDGDKDFFAANSDIMRFSNLEPGTYEGSQYYRNEGGWRFTRVEGQPFSEQALAASSAAAGDIDNDGDLDLFLGMYAHGHENPRDRIFLNDGAGHFTPDPRFEGPVHEQWATGAGFVDLDLDGDLDLLHSGYQSGIAVWINDGAGAFSAHPGDLSARVDTYSGLASGDIDGDGDLDVVLGNWGEPIEGNFITILKNESERCGRSLSIQLSTAAGAPDPLGARVTLITRGRNGERRQVREAIGQTTMRSQSASTFLFGAPNGERVVRAEIRWPDGRAENATRLRFDRGNEFRDD